LEACWLRSETPLSLRESAATNARQAAQGSLGPTQDIMGSLFFRLVALAGVMIMAGGVTHALDPSARITFDNLLGDPASIKLIGPVRQTVEVPLRQRITVTVPGGQYYVLVRHGSADGYDYAKGDAFVVTQTATRHSVITITLRDSFSGNYANHPTTADEFDKAAGFSPQSHGRAPAAIVCKPDDPPKISTFSFLIDRRARSVQFTEGWPKEWPKRPTTEYRDQRWDISFKRDTDPPVQSGLKNEVHLIIDNNTGIFRLEYRLKPRDICDKKTKQSMWNNLTECDTGLRLLQTGHCENRNKQRTMFLDEMKCDNIESNGKRACQIVPARQPI
jgi:hypothetical protein